MIHKEKRNVWTKIIIIILFIITLASLRFFWINAFTESEQREIIKGEIDLRDWDFSEWDSITLVGEWSFYPYELLEDIPGPQIKNKVKHINVPGDWSEALNENEDSPYGYGSYHLRIYVDPTEDRSFSMRIPSVRSVSALYANGLLLGKSGLVGKSKEDSHAWNVPYSSTSIRSDDFGIIDIVLQVSNYVDPRSSGLVRAVKFGNEDDLKSETELSTHLQIGTAVILLVHALFACLIFLVGIRDRRLLCFAIAIIALTFMNVTGGDEKVLYQYVNLNYVTTFKLAIFVMVLLSWALVCAVGPQINKISKTFLPIYTVILIVFSFIMFLLPMESLSLASTIVMGIVVVSAIIAIVTLLWIRKKIEGGIWVPLALVALASHHVWWAYMLQTGIKVVYYPFDLIIFIVCLGGVWFKHYNQMHINLKKQTEKLLKADKEKDEFLAITSHELRNPLHSILNMSQGVLERERGLLQKDSVKNLETILSVSKRMSFLLNDLLDITRLQESNTSLQIKPISLQAITAGVIDIVDYRLEGKPVKIINKIPRKFPLIMGDENRTIQILFNLLHNAVKFTASGEISVQVSKRKGMALISVRDTGIGMDQDTMQTIFEAYIQGNSQQSMLDGGFGLGLNISKKLVELQGGTMTVHSDLGIGSTFTFSLPVTEYDEAIESNHESAMSLINAENTAIITKDKSQTIINKNGNMFSESFPRILVVDDDPVNLEVMETILRIKQYNITTVLTGEKALTLLSEQEWDLIISDVMMPEMSGFELTRRIRLRFTMSELPILLVTARNRQVDIESGFLSGANDYVTKPIDAVEFRSRVNALTEVRKSFRERLQMESAWMQAQMQPHFLFNTLNSIIALSEIDIKRMQKLLEAFSNVLRGKFNFQNKDDFVSIESELNIIRSYLYIEKERFRDRLNVTWEVDDSIQIDIPTLSIQPLVENAITHGIMKQSQGGNVIIRITDCETYVTVCVEDDGVGMKDDVLQRVLKLERASNSGVGLLNTNVRLHRLYGKGLHIESAPGMGTKVCFTVPNTH